MITLSILIPTLEKRRPLYDALIQSLIAQGQFPDVEIVTDCDRGERSTGAKRNDLVMRAQGKYVVHIDDDDEVAPDYISEILTAAVADMDCITFDGWMTTNGQRPIDFDIALNNPYIESTRPDGTKYYLRWPNHISVIRREIAIQVPFPDKYQYEDFEWSKELHDRGLLKTSIKINKKLYHYVFRTHK